LKRDIPSLRMPCNCGSKAHCVTAENSPFGLKQFGRLLLHFAKTHNVSGIFVQLCPASTAIISLDIGVWRISLHSNNFLCFAREAVDLYCHEKPCTNFYYILFLKDVSLFFPSQIV